MKETKKQKEKIAKVMHEFKEGELHIGKSDKIVKKPKQAIAIALSEAGLSKKMKGGNIDYDFEIHNPETIELTIKHAGISKSEYEKLHPETKIKLVKNALNNKMEKGGGVGKDVVIQKSGKGEMALWHIIDAKTPHSYSTEVFFDSKEEATKFANKKGYNIVETFENEYAKGGGVESSFNSTKKGLEGKDQQHRIDELINVVKKNNWSSKPLTVESGVVKTYAKMYDLEPIRVASIFNKYQKPKMADGGKVGEDFKFNYMMLDRLQSDNDYYLKHPDEQNLWAGSVDKQISEMKKLWNQLPKDKKPEWLSMEDILEYEKKMKKNYANGGDIYSKSSYEAMLRKYDQLGAKLEDAIDEKNTNEVARLKSEMNALESKINNYERGGSSFTYSIGGL